MRIVIRVVSVVVALPLMLSAYQEGPSPNMGGGFGDSMSQMSQRQPLNALGESSTVTGVPLAYTPGQAYPITLELERDGLKGGGFEIVARLAAAGRREAGGHARNPGAEE